MIFIPEKSAKPNFPAVTPPSSVTCAVFTMYSLVVQRNPENEKSDVRVWRLCMPVRVTESMRELHGHVPLVSVSHEVLQSCVRIL